MKKGGKFLIASLFLVAGLIIGLILSANLGFQNTAYTKTTPGKRSAVNPITKIVKMAACILSAKFIFLLFMTISSY